MKIKELLKKTLSILGIIALIFTLYFAFLQIKEIIKSKKYPQIALAWYKEESNSIRIISPNEITLELTDEAFKKNFVRFPINIAIKNEENKRLEVIKIQLSYDEKYKIISNASKKIPDRLGRLIYEHSIETLESISNFTPLANIDTLHIPINIFFEEIIVLSSEGIPAYWIVSGVYHNDEDFKPVFLNFNIDIFCKDRPSLQGIFRIKMDPALERLHPPKVEINTPDLLLSDFRLFERETTSFSIMDEWEGQLDSSDVEIKYFLLKDKVTKYQFIYANNVLRRVMIDYEDDGYSDLVLLDENGDGEPDKKIEFLGKVAMVDWNINALGNRDILK